MKTLICPACGQSGSSVKPITLQSLLRPELLPSSGVEKFHFCGGPECPVAYFDDRGTVFSKDDLIVEVGIKESAPPRTICYCFDHTMEAIRDEIVATGTSTAVESIAEAMKDGCSCDTLNPQGTCCLGSVKRFVRETTQAQEAESLTPAPAACSAGLACDTTAVGDSVARVSACCPDKAPSPGHRAGLLAAAGSVLTAALASACCWVPLVLIAFGISAGGFSRFIEPYRPLLLGGSVAMLCAGFFLLYVRKPVCATNESCSVRDRRLLWFNRAMLWVALLAVGAFAFFPNYAGILLADAHSETPAILAAEQVEVALQIEGMTCEACATLVHSALSKVPGVDQCTVSYDNAEAVCVVDSATLPELKALVEAVEAVGYNAAPQVNSP